MMEDNVVQLHTAKRRPSRRQRPREDRLHELLPAILAFLNRHSLPGGGISQPGIPGDQLRLLCSQEVGSCHLTATVFRPPGAHRASKIIEAWAPLRSKTTKVLHLILPQTAEGFDAANPEIVTFRRGPWEDEFQDLLREALA